MYDWIWCLAGVLVLVACVVLVNSVVVFLFDFCFSFYLIVCVSGLVASFRYVACVFGFGSCIDCVCLWICCG